MSVCLSQIRYRKDKVQSKQTPVFVVVSGVKDLSNGCAIAAALHFYCPQILPLEGKTHTFIYQSRKLTEILMENIFRNVIYLSLLPSVDVCLKDTMSPADSMYNLQLIREFCESHLKICCPLQLEDLLYAPPVLQVRNAPPTLQVRHAPPTLQMHAPPTLQVRYAPPTLQVQFLYPIYQ